MFGMLDYRAFQLYRLIWFIPNLVLVWLTNLGLPLATYAIAYYFYAQYFNLAPMIYVLWIFAVIGFFFVSIPFAIFNWAITKLFDFIFNIIIDVIPAEGRNEDQANFVLKSGKGGANQILMENLNPKDWNDAMIRKSVKYADWVARLCFRGKIYARLYAVRDHYLHNENREFSVSVSEITQVIEREGLTKSWSEEIISTKYFRQLIIQILFFLFLLFKNPFA